MNEIRVLTKCDHANIVKLIKAKIGGTLKKPNEFKLKNLMYYVMPYVTNYELFRLIEFTGSLSENASKYIFKQILLGLKYLHSNSIAHRDLKPENILIDTNLKVTLADFGSSTFVNEENGIEDPIECTEQFGSVEYNAPEINKGNKYYAKRADIFSSGVLLFVMMTALQPFRHSGMDDPYYCLLSKDNLNSFWSNFPSLSPEFKDLFENLSNSESRKRMNIDEIFQHKWLKGLEILPEEIELEFQQKFFVIGEKLRDLYEMKKQRKKFNLDFLKPDFSMDLLIYNEDEKASIDLAHALEECEEINRFLEKSQNLNIIKEELLEELKSDSKK